MLVDNTLFGIHDKVKEAVEILQQYEPQEGYYLCFSGGKDSLCCYYLCQLAGVKYDAVYNYTTIDPPEVVRFIRTFEDVQISKPDICFWDLIVKKGMPPTRTVRYCCSELKERGGKGRVKIMGVREEESTKRKGRQVVMLNGESPLGKVINIVYNWTESEVWEFITCFLNADYCSLYDEGKDRIGCIGCPMQGAKGQKNDFERYPAYKRAYLKCFERMLQERERRGLTTTTFTDAQSVMDWWMGEKPKDKNQMTLDDITEE